MRFFTGVVYTVIGPSKLGGCVVFSWLGFWGLFFFYRAFTIAVPEGRRRSYAYLLFFLPSLVFWPSSIGKDAWMMFSMGMATYGIAQLLTRWTIGGVVAAAAGLWLASLVRPHIAAFMAIAFVVALVMRKSRSEHRELAPVVKGAAIVLVLLLAVVLTLKTSGSLKIGVDGGLGAALTSVEDRTSKGGSDFSPTIADSPVRFPMAAITVLFRPFIFEAHNTPGAPRRAGEHGTDRALPAAVPLGDRGAQVVATAAVRGLLPHVRRPVHHRVLELRELRAPSA